MLNKHKELFKTIEIAGCQIKNRYSMAPMGPYGLVDDGGILKDEGIEYYVERAKGGIGLIITGICIVEDEYEGINPMVLFVTKRTDKWRAMQQFSKMTERIHAYGSKIFLQLSSGFGRVGIMPTFVQKAIAPSPVENKWDPNTIQRALTTAEVEQYITAFGEAAAFAKLCGFDGVEIHAVHEGYLLDQFATACFNQRTDRFGGSFENRYRFATEIVQTIKAACGNDFPVSLRYSPKHYMKRPRVGAVAGESFTEMGRDLPEGIEAAKLLVAAGYDVLNVDTGCYDAHYWNHPGIYQKDGLFLDTAAKIKEVVNVPIIVAGRMDDPDVGAKAIREGKCDMVGLGRPSLADAYLPNKVREGHGETVRPCISCNYGCSTRVFSAGKIGCTVNVQCASELKDKIASPGKVKKILIIGGGPAGAECARIAAMRGHKVTLMEKGDRIGGALLLASKTTYKTHDLQLAHWFENELKSLGVNIKLNTTATKASIAKEKADTVVMATGAKPIIPNIKGIGNKNVYLAEDILNDVSKAGKNVVIIGAGQLGIEMGIWLLEKGHKVTIVEMTDKFMLGGSATDTDHAKVLLDYYHGTVLLLTQAQEITNKGMKVKSKNGEKFISADTVIIAAGYKVENALYKELEEKSDSIYNIGDSSQVGNIYYAIHTGFELANTI
jgi:2-enoate reductase